ncbi:MAG: hypothetical protein ACLGHN_15625 [Bacteriovoracia bacterium]
MVRFLLLSITLLSCSSQTHDLPDIEDKNIVPFYLENPEKEEERIRIHDEPLL